MKAHTKINPIGSAWGVFLTCLVMVFAGLTLAEWELVVRPVEVVENQPPASQRLRVVFVKTVEDPTADWEEKIGWMMRGRTSGEMFLTAGDLNTFLKRSMKPQTRDTQIYFYTRMTPGRLTLGLMADVTWLAHPFCVQVRGTLQRGPNGYFFDPERMYVGALPLPMWLARPLMAGLFAKMFESPEAGPLKHSWRGLREIRLRERRMELLWP